MKINHKILLSVTISFGIGLVIFYFVMTWYPSNFDIMHIWTSSLDPSDSRTVVLIGSSHTGALNASHIQEYLHVHGKNVKVYNLAIPGDYPSRRLETVDQLIALKPTLILYGIELRMFEIESTVGQNKINAFEVEKNNILPDQQTVLNSIAEKLSLTELITQIPKSPKIITLHTLHYLFKNPDQTTIVNVSSNRPFYNLDNVHLPILPQDKIKKLYNADSKQPNIGTVDTNNEFFTLKKILYKFKKNDVDVVVFATPKNKIYLDWLSDANKKSFDLILKRIEDSGVTVYPKYDQYGELDVWTDADANHVTQERIGLVYSDDIAKITLKELEQQR